MSRVKYHTKCGCVFSSVKDMVSKKKNNESGKKVTVALCPKHLELFSHRVITCEDCSNDFEYRRKDNRPSGISPALCKECARVKGVLYAAERRETEKNKAHEPVDHWCKSYDEFCSGKDGHCIMPMFNCKIGLKQIRQEARKNAAF